jgi:hypothetical protein
MTLLFGGSRFFAVLNAPPLRLMPIHFLPGCPWQHVINNTATVSVIPTPKPKVKTEPTRPDVCPGSPAKFMFKVDRDGADELELEGHDGCKQDSEDGESYTCDGVPNGGAVIAFKPKFGKAKGKVCSAAPSLSVPLNPNVDEEIDLEGDAQGSTDNICPDRPNGAAAFRFKTKRAATSVDSFLVNSQGVKVEGATCTPAKGATDDDWAVTCTGVPVDEQHSLNATFTSSKGE